MKGTGRTVFAGSRVEEFQVEVLGILHRYQPGRDLILVRASGGPLEQTGIIAGMSGSPIYLEGRLAGALAYAYSFAKEAIAGVTPIGDMLETLDRESPVGPADERQGALSSLQGEGVSPASPPESAEALAFAFESRAAELHPVQMPLMVSGFCGPVVDEMRRFFAGEGLMVAQGGVAGTEVRASDLVPGSAVSVRLVEGDANIAAIGTLTYRHGDRVLAFGHPLFHAGDVALPLGGATIAALLPSQNVSMKFGSATEGDLGVIEQDRSTGIGGRLGASVDMLPLSLVLRSVGAEPVQFHYRVVRHRDLTPSVVRWVLLNSILTREQGAGTSTVELTTKITLADGRSFSHRDVEAETFSAGTVGDVAGGSVKWILENVFERASIASVDVEVSLDSRLRAARLERVVLERDAVPAGEMVRGRVLVRPYREAPVWKGFELRVPEDAPGEFVLIQVCDGASLLEQEVQRAPGRFLPNSLEELLRVMEDLPSKDRLYVRLWSTEERGVVLLGREVGPLPPSTAAVFGSRRRSGGVTPTEASELGRGEIETGMVMTGCETMKVTIERPLEGKTP